MNQLFSHLIHTEKKIINGKNGKNVSDKEIDIVVNPIDKDKYKVCGYFKDNDKNQFICKDNLAGFFNKNNRDVSYRDLIKTLKSELEFIKTFDKLDEFQFLNSNKLSKRFRKKHFTNHEFNNGFLKFDILKKIKNKHTKKREKQKQTQKRKRKRK